ncbi:MAG: AraC family transcriptional regulator [Pseudomonadota bacterium]
MTKPSQPKLTTHYGSYLDFYEDVYSHTLIEKRSASRISVSMFKSFHEAGDCSDAPSSDLVLGTHLGTNFVARANLGAGFYEGPHYTNDIFLIPPYCSTDIEVFEPIQMLAIAIPYKELKTMLHHEQLLPNDGNFGHLHYGCHRDPVTRLMIHKLWDEAANDHPYGTLYADQVVLQMVARLLYLKGDSSTKLFKGGLSLMALKRIIDLMHADLACEGGLERIATAVDLSPWHMARAFKYSTGMAPYEYLTFLRLEKAKLFLETTNLPVTSIARKVGYQSTQALARVFHKHVGCSPRSYRKQAKVF